MRTQPDARDIAMALEYGAGATLEEVGRRHGVTREYVRQRLRATGVEIRTSANGARARGRSEVLEYAVLEIAKVLDDWSLARIAAAVGTRVPKKPAGRTHPKILRPSRARGIIAAWQAGHSHPDIAAAFGVTTNYVGQLLHKARARGEEIRPGNRREAAIKRWAKRRAKEAQP